MKLKFFLKLGTRFSKFSIPAKIICLATGLASTIWFLVRVVPKPSRANYPCMRAAAPLMSGFIIYILGFFTSLFAFKKALQNIRRTRYLNAILFITVALITGITYNILVVSGNSNSVQLSAQPEQFTPNQPIGAAKGINPGRVVWVRDADATNKSFNPTYSKACFSIENVDSAIINRMTIKSVLALTGKEDIKEAWDTLFRFFNVNHSKGNIGYQQGEKIFIKINCNSAWGHPAVTGSEFNLYGSSLGRNLNEDYSFKKNTAAYGTHESGPYVMKSVLYQLVKIVGVPEENIYIGDPMRDIHKYNYDIMHDAFPNVHYLGHSNTYGRTLVTLTNDTIVYFSDKGQTLRNYNNQPLKGIQLYSVVKDADYIINLAGLKAHSGEGMTNCAKNYFGTIGRIWAIEMHNGMVSPNFDFSTRPIGTYRVLVDLMGHKDLGGKTMLFLVDGTFFSPDAYGLPEKFQNTPFNGDWPSSVFASQDIVAIESVCYDLIASQYKSNCGFQYITMKGICDHLQQAADPSSWPSGIVYDPEKDGIPLTSLGVYEHWNNSVDQQYSRNLGSGNGIELITPGPIDDLIAKPIELKAQALSDSEIKIEWKDNSEKETGYVVEISTEDSLHYNQVAELEANTTSYQSTGLEMNGNYYFRVKAAKNDISSDYSNEVSCIAVAPVGIQKPEMNQQVQIIKNQNNGIIVSIKNEYQGKVSVMTYNSAGQLIKSDQFCKLRGLFEQTVNLLNCKGIYIIKVQYANSTFSSKILL